MKKILKRLPVFLLTVLIISFSAVGVNAESVYANIESISTRVDIPDSFTVTSANATPNNTVTYTANATTADSSKSLVITSERTDETEEIFNFKYLTEKEINSEVENIKNGNTTLCSQSFNNVSDASFKESNNYIIFILYNTDILNNTNVSYATAYTVINGELLTVKYVSNNTPLTIDEKTLFNQITDSINVTQLYVKPQNIDLGGIFGTLFTVIIFIVIIVTLCTLIYYNSNSSKIYRKESRKLADKYYNELKNEGLMEENTNLSEPVTAISDKQQPPASEKIKDSNNLFNVINGFAKPSLIDDEWEDIDLEKMFSTSDNNSSDDRYTSQKNTEEYEEENVLYLDKGESFIYNQASNESTEDVESISFVSKAESAKRFAQMYIGSTNTDENHYSTYHEYDKSPSQQNDASTDEENIDPEILRRVEERQRQRRLKNKKKRRRKTINSDKASSTKKKSVSRKSRARSNETSDPFADFQLDGYWDKYR